MPNPPAAPTAVARQRFLALPLQLFSPAGDAEYERRIDELVRSFLRGPGVGSGVDTEIVAREFRDATIPSHPLATAEYLEFLARSVVAHSTRTSSPRYIGHMTSALPHFVQPLSKLVAALNQNVVKLETSRAFSPLERQALAMMHRLVYDFPPEFYAAHAQAGESTLGVVTSGGTIANLTALWCARNAALGPSEGFAGVEQEGMAAALHHHGYRRAVVIGSALMHYSFDKAADYLGLGVRNVVRVPVGRRHGVDVAAMRREMERCRAEGALVLALVGVAGSTDSGSIDPLEEVAELAREAGAHFHVDAAWGGALLFSRRHRGKLAGIDRADSVTIDPHKQLYTPLGTGLLFFRDPGLARTVEKHARYILRRGSADLGRRSLEGSRPGAVVFLHAGLHLLGREGYEQLVDEGMRKARYMADRVRERPGFELLAEPVTNIVLYRALPGCPRDGAAPEAVDRFNVRLQQAQWEAGRTFVSRTTLDPGDGSPPVVALRAVLANPLTREEDVDAVLDDQVAIAATLEGC
ncbi:MAG TPA: aminotransferase class V-fold PLP-dependent enzyme [Longimicrobiaceae bacterium]|nr:aminotransferase class V-fold PLP-dependent enzyme [Longimicrobiaceae bacterium]